LLVAAEEVEMIITQVVVEEPVELLKLHTI
jgi:hypothetical protein